MENIPYILVGETAKEICEKYGEDITKLESWQVCELLDRLIDEALSS